MLEPVLLGFKILFLILLYLFIYRIVRGVARDLSASVAAGPAAMPPGTAAPRPPRRPQAVSAPPSRPAPPAGAPAGKAATPAAAGKTGEFEYLVSRLNPRLVVQHSKVVDSGKVFKLKGGATIGRAPGSDIVLPDDYVSQTHARIFARKQFLYIEDLGSTNGTFIDGRRVEGEQQIRPGQEIVLGDTIFRYEE